MFSQYCTFISHLTRHSFHRMCQSIFSGRILQDAERLPKGFHWKCGCYLSWKHPYRAKNCILSNWWLLMLSDVPVAVDAVFFLNSLLNFVFGDTLGTMESFSRSLPFPSWASHLCIAKWYLMLCIDRSDAYLSSIYIWKQIFCNKIKPPQQLSFVPLWLFTISGNHTSFQRAFV